MVERLRAGLLFLFRGRRSAFESETLGAPMHGRSHFAQPAIMQPDQLGDPLGHPGRQILRLGGVSLQIEEVNFAFLGDELPVAGTNRPPAARRTVAPKKVSRRRLSGP